MLCILVPLLGLTITLYRKNENAFKMHKTIDDAILLYKKHCIYRHKKPAVDHDDVEHYFKTAFRIWDWGYTKLLPKEKLEIIKPYIGLPACCGLPITLNGMAENGCDDCKFRRKCDAKRKECNV